MEGDEAVTKSKTSNGIEVCVLPLMNETVWLTQNKYEEAEALYHKILAGTNNKKNHDKKSSDCPSDTLHTVEVLQLQPLVSESVWLKQTDYENAEAKYHKVRTVVKSVDKPNEIKERKLSNKKTENVSWAEKLENKLKSIEDYSHTLEETYGKLRKANGTVQSLLPRLSSALATCFNLLKDELSESKTHVDCVEYQLTLFKAIIASIKEKMAGKDKTCYKSYEVFCQSMADRLSHLSMEMMNLCQTSSGMKIATCEKSLREVLNNVIKVNDMGPSMNTVKHAEFKMVSLISALDSIFKRADKTKVGLPKKNDIKEFLSSENSVSVESLDDFSSLCGDCSDFNTEDDEFGKKPAQQTGQKSASKPSLSPQKKKTGRGKRGGTMNHANSPGNTSNITIINSQRDSGLPKSKKSPKTVIPSNAKGINSGQANQKGRGKTVASGDHRPVQKPPSNSKQSKATPPRNTACSVSGNSLYGRGNKSSFVTTQPFGSPISPMFSPGFPLDYNQSNTSTSIYPSFNSPNSSFSSLNPVIMEEQLNEIALKIHMQMATKQTLQLQQMLQETERLRQLAMERPHQNFIQEEFQHGYQMLLRAFLHHQSICSEQQRLQHQKKKHQFSAVTKSHSQPLVQAQPQPLPKKPKQKSKDKKKPQEALAPNTKGTPKVGQEQDEACEAIDISTLPGAVTVQSKPKAPRKSFPTSSSEVNRVASFHPQVQDDRQKCGVSSVVVLDDIGCVLVVDIINSCLKLYKYSVESGPQKYSFNFRTTLNLPGPFYMAKIGGNKVVVTRDSRYITLIKVTPANLKPVNSVEMRLQYYGVTFVTNNIVAAAAYEANRIDLLNMDQLGHFQVKTLMQTHYGPELLSSVPGSNDIVYLEKVPQQCMYLKGVNLDGLPTFSMALGGGPSDVWNLSCIDQKILCLNKQENSLQLFSRSGKKRAFLPWPTGTIDQPFALAFSQCGDLYVANDGLWDAQENHYVTTEINVFSFING